MNFGAILRTKATLSATLGIPATHARSSSFECSEGLVSDVREAVPGSLVDIDNDNDGEQVDETGAAAWSLVDIHTSNPGTTNFEDGHKYEVGDEVLVIVSGSASQYGPAKIENTIHR